MPPSSSFHSNLSRYLNRRVCIDLTNRSTIWGKLVSVNDGFLRLVDTIVQSDSDNRSWFEDVQYSSDDGGGMRNCETVVRTDYLQLVSCVDDAGPLPEPEPPAPKKKAEKVKAKAKSEEFPTQHDRLELQFGHGLLQLVSGDQGQALTKRFQQIRRELALQAGVVLPVVRIRDNLQLEQYEYRFYVNGQVVAGGELRGDKRLVLAGDADIESVPGENAVDPVYGIEAKWVEPEHAGRAEVLGATVCDACTVLITHFNHVIRGQLHEVITRGDVLQLLTDCPQGCNRDRAVPGKVSLELFFRVVQRLLEERVSISQLPKVVQSAAFHRTIASDFELYVQKIRIDLARAICDPLAVDGRIEAIPFDDDAVSELHNIRGKIWTQQNKELLQNFAESIGFNFENRVVLVHDPKHRREVFEILAALEQEIHVLSVDEVPELYTVQLAVRFATPLPPASQSKSKPSR